MKHPLTTSYGTVAAVLCTFALASAACTGGAPSDQARADAPAKQPPADVAENNGDAKDEAPSDTPKGNDAAKAEAAAGDLSGCQLFCLDGTSPCGDKCIAEGESCPDAAAGSACEGSKRPATAFKKGDRALEGIVRADVAAYNKAQGDPIDGFFTLEQAFEGAPELADASKGKLFATLKTDLGDIRCELFPEKAPLTVANFVGLARGKRPWYDKATKAWEAKPYYENTLIHRVIDEFMIQMGDHTGSGRGGPGYFVPDEFDPALKHNGPGTLSMANRNRPDPRTQKLRVDPKTGQTIGNTGSSQFFVTVAKGNKAGYLDGRHTVFGKCDTATAFKIGKVPTRPSPPPLKDRPVQDIKLQTITFERADK